MPSSEEVLQNLIGWCMLTTHVEAGDAVLDINAGSGELLIHYPKGVKRVAIDPDRDKLMNGIRHRNYDVGIAGVFCQAAVEKYAPFKVITFRNPEEVFPSLLLDVNAVLHPIGTFIIEGRKLSIATLNQIVSNASVQLSIIGADENEAYGIRLFFVHAGSDFSGQKMLANYRSNVYMKLQQLLYDERAAAQSTSLRDMFKQGTAALGSQL